MKKPAAATAVGELQQQRQPETRLHTATTFVFPSAPPAPSEYAFVDGDVPPYPAVVSTPSGLMARNGATFAGRPPPPYVFGRISSHVYDMIDPKSGHEWMFRVALVEFLFAVLAACCAVSCVVEVDKYCPYYTGVWVSIIFLTNSILGVLAAKKATVNFFVAHLVTSVLAVVAAIILLALSIHNWNAAGYRNGEACIINTYDTGHLKYIWHSQVKFPFSQCVYDLKLGLTFNIVLMVCAVLEGILALASTIFCFKAVCHCTAWRYSRR